MDKNIPKELGDLLGLSESELHCLGVAIPPGTQVAQGNVATPAMTDELKAMADDPTLLGRCSKISIGEASPLPLTESGDSQTVPLPQEVLDRLDETGGATEVTGSLLVENFHLLFGQLYQYDPNPSICVFESEQADVALVHGTAVSLGKRHMLDVGAAAFTAIRLCSEGGSELLLAAYRQDIYLILQRVKVSILDRLAQWTPPDDLFIAILPLADLLGQWSCEAWLQVTFERLESSPSVLDRVAAMGLIGRLWSPAAPEMTRESLKSIVAGGHDPPLAVEQWAKQLDAETVADLEHLSVARADSLMLQYDNLENMVAETGLHDAELLRQLIHARDDLESLFHVLNAAGGGESLGRLLQALDREAVTHLTLLSCLDGLGDDDRIRSVSWQELESWWGNLAEYS